jgi:hypothetical protein
LLDHLHAADQAGEARGYARGLKANAEALARQWLHEDARKWTERAVTLASAKGPSWAEAIRQQAEAVGE